MRLNGETVVWCDTLSLWPYDGRHVPKYHAWMQDEGIRQLTASEPLSLQEEYDMQASWREDADKLTFIVVRKSSTHDLDQSVQDMIGDVNLFISPRDEHDQQDSDADQDVSSGEYASTSAAKYNGELELMIAEEQARGQGYGKAALLLFIAWILQHKHRIVPGGDLTTLVVKIGVDNAVSLALFKKLGFVHIHYSEYFRECELHLPITDDTQSAIISLMKEQDRSWQEARLAVSPSRVES